MELSVCCWALSSLPQAQVFSTLADEGVEFIDVRTSDVDSPETVRALRESGLRVGCLSLAFALEHLPPLSGKSPERARLEAQRGIALAAEIGAPVVYLCPDEDASSEALDRFSAELKKLASFSENLGVVLCIEHFPGLALSSIEATAAFVRSAGHPNLKLLIDVGHAQITNENTLRALRTHADILGYLHVNDNHGDEDLHLGLLEGVMERSTLADTLEEAGNSSYDGPVSIELSWTLENPEVSVRRSIRLMRELL